MQQESGKKEIAVTFDDFPFHEQELNLFHLKYNMIKMIETLTYEGIKAVAFINEGHFYKLGETEKFIKLVEFWLDSGMEIGNHTFSHPSLHNVPVQAFKDDILKGEKISLSILQKQGKTSLYFRYPYLKTGNSLKLKEEITGFLKKHYYINVPVSIETFDYLFSILYFQAKIKKQENIMLKIGKIYLFYFEKLLEYFENFSTNLFNRQIKHILLLHFNDLNTDYLSNISGILKSRGFSFISLEEALMDKVYALEDNYIGNYGLSWLHRCNFNLNGSDKFSENFHENILITDYIKLELANFLYQ